MNWEAIGAIGEIKGATAVVITLIYLAVQFGCVAVAIWVTSIPSSTSASEHTQWH